MKQSSKLDKVLTQAEQFYARGETDKALEKLCSKNKLGLKDPFGLNLAGAIYLENGDYANAAKCLKKAVSLNPNYPEAHSNYGYVLANLGEFDEALKHCDKSIELRPNFVDAILNKGNALLGLGRSEQAIECYDKVLKFDPNNTQALASRGSALADLGEHAKAIAEFRKATSRQPNDAGLHFEFANSMREMGELERAKTLFEKGLSLEPENLKQRVNYANLLAQLDRHGDAIKILQDLIKIAPDVPELQLNLVELMKGADDSAGTFETYAKAYTLKPEDPNIALNYANRLREAGRDEEALEVLSKSLKQYPNNILLLNSSALSLSNLSRYEKALEICERAIDLDPGDHSVYVTRGFVERTAGMILESNESYEKALSLDPENSQIHFNIADNFSHINRFEDTLEHLEKALEDCSPIDPRHLQKCHALFSLDKQQELISLCQRRFESAEDRLATLIALGVVEGKKIFKHSLSSLEELVQDQPNLQLVDTTDLRFLRAHFLEKLGRYEEAWIEIVQANNNAHLMNAIEVEEQRIISNKVREEALRFEYRQVKRNSSIDALSLFILGPSRSGKTSIENLLGNIDGIVRGLENQILNDLTKFRSAERESSRLNLFAGVSEKQLSEFSERYFSELERRYGPFKVFTNTMPGAIADVGRILIHVRNAKFVFVKRERIDLAVRIFFKKYRTENYYAYNFKTILDHIDWYFELMSIWSEKFPRHCITINYEDVVENPLSVRQQIAEFCNINDAGIESHAPYDDRGSSKSYAKYLPSLRADTGKHEITVLEAKDRSAVLDQISNSEQASLISSYGLEPQIYFQHSNANIYLSKKFKLVDGDRQLVLMFVSIDHQTYPRLVYQSASHGTFRVVDGVLEGWFSKGPGENFISLPPRISEYLLRSQSKISLRRTKDEIAHLLEHADDHLYFHRNPENQHVQIEDGLEAYKLPLLVAKDGEKFREPGEVTVLDGFEPDYSDMGRVFDSVSIAAGTVEAYFYSSKNRKLTYTIMRDFEDKVWFADVNHHSASLNKFGMAERQLDFGELLTPRWERKRHIVEEFISLRKSPVSKSYYSNWNYVREIPLIQSWYHSNGIEIPEKE